MGPEHLHRVELGRNAIWYPCKYQIIKLLLKHISIQMFSFAQKLLQKSRNFIRTKDHHRMTMSKREEQEKKMRNLLKDIGKIIQPGG